MDDDPSVIRGLWRILRQNRPAFQINTAASAAQALSALSELSYDVVITDLHMPGGGNAVLDALIDLFPETARIIHSSQPESIDTADSRAHVVLPKPATDEQLLDAIEISLQLVRVARSACSGC